jgi:hypothetical protein
VTQWTRVQRLSPENKGGFPYMPFRTGSRNGVCVRYSIPEMVCVWGTACPYMITCYFIGCFNLWGKVTLLWSPGNIPQLWFSSTH